MGHIAHLRKTIQIKNTLIKRRKNPLFTLWELNENLNGSSFEQTWITFIQGCIVPSLVEIGPVVLEKKIKKFTTTTTRTTDKFWSEKLTWAFGSGEVKKK